MSRLIYTVILSTLFLVARINAFMPPDIYEWIEIYAHICEDLNPTSPVFLETEEAQEANCNVLCGPIGLSRQACARNRNSLTSETPFCVNVPEICMLEYERQFAHLLVPTVSPMAEITTDNIVGNGDGSLDSLDNNGLQDNDVDLNTLVSTTGDLVPSSTLTSVSDTTAEAVTLTTPVVSPDTTISTIPVTTTTTTTTVTQPPVSTTTSQASTTTTTPTTTMASTTVTTTTAPTSTTTELPTTTLVSTQTTQVTTTRFDAPSTPPISSIVSTPSLSTTTTPNSASSENTFQDQTTTSSESSRTTVSETATPSSTTTTPSTTTATKPTTPLFRFTTTLPLFTRPRIAPFGLSTSRAINLQDLNFVPRSIHQQQKTFNTFFTTSQKPQNFDSLKVKIDDAIKRFRTAKPFFPEFRTVRTTRAILTDAETPSVAIQSTHAAPIFFPNLPKRILHSDENLFGAQKMSKTQMVLIPATTTQTPLFVVDGAAFGPNFVLDELPLSDFKESLDSRSSTVPSTIPLDSNDTVPPPTQSPPQTAQIEPLTVAPFIAASNVTKPHKKRVFFFRNRHSGKKIFIPSEGETCVDGDPACDFWSRNGECELNPRYMLTVCKLSCHVCTPLTSLSSQEFH